MASHGASFHAPQEVTRLLGVALNYAQTARIDIARVLARHGYSKEVPMPDISTKDKAQSYIGLDMKKLKAQKKNFIDNVVPQWVKTAKKNGRFITKEM